MHYRDNVHQCGSCAIVHRSHPVTKCTYAFYPRGTILYICFSENVIFTALIWLQYNKIII